MATLDPAMARELKNYLNNQLTQEMETHSPGGISREAAWQRLAEICATARVQVENQQRAQIFNAIIDDLLGYGPIQPLVDDPTISEIMVNGARSVFIERDGALIETDIQFEDDMHLMHIIDRMVYPLGRRVDRDHPMVDARLPDGSRVNVIIPPAAVDGPCITIRKFLHNRMTMDDLVQTGTLTDNMAEFLQACIVARLNIIISGPTSSGKTTFLNILTGYIPGQQRIVTIEDAVELKLQQRHVIRLETKNANLDGAGEVTIRDLVRNALRMRPDRIIIGEVRGGEAHGYDPGHEHRAPRLDHHRARQFPARCHLPAGDAGHDGRAGNPAAGHPPPDRLGDQPGDPHLPAHRRHAQDHQYHRSIRDGRRRGDHVGYLQI